MKLIFATNNSGKLEEMKQILAGLEIEVISPAELGVNEEIAEDRDSFEENSAKKADYIAQKTGYSALADDSGLCIEALDGRPGIYTARWAGEGATGEDLVNYALKQMEGIENRSAWFETAAVLAHPDGQTNTFKGITSGEITKTPRGEMNSKLPYDVIFSPEGDERTFAEMTADEKNELSHRGRAFKEMREHLKKRRY